jgi:hypothetical protein
MSNEQVSTGQNGAVEGSETAAQQSKGAKEVVTRRAPASRATANSGRAAGPAGSQSTHDLDSAKEQDAESSDGTVKAKWDLPEDFDLDAADEDTLKKLQKWKKKIKINGKERVVGLFDAIRYLQKDLAADEKLHVTNQLARQHQALVESLRNDPISVLKQAGHNIDEIAKQRISEQLQLQAMSPEQRQAYEAAKEAQYYRSVLEKMQAQKQEQQRNMAKEGAQQKWQTQIIDAMEKAGLPYKSPIALKAATQFILAERKKGNTDVTAYDVMQDVKDFFQENAKAFLSQMHPKDVLAFLGKESSEGLRSAFLEDVQDPIQSKAFTETPGGKYDAARVKPRDVISPEEYREQLFNKFNQ